MARRRDGGSAVVCLAALALVVPAAGCKPGGTMIDRTLSCEYDYLNERFGGLLFLFDLADDAGHFEHTFAGGPVETVTGDWDRDTGAFSLAETYRAGYATLTREVSGTAVFEDDGDGSWSSSIVSNLADGSTNTSTADTTRAGCTTTGTRTDDEGTVFDTVGTMVSLGEATFSSSALRTDGVSITTDGFNYLDWTSAAHVERDDPAVTQNPDYVEDRTGAADGSGQGTYEAWYPNGNYEQGTAAYAADGTVMRTSTRYEDDTMAITLATVESTTYLDGSGTATIVFTDMMGAMVTCTREWTAEMANCTITCDNGATPPC